MDPLLGTEQDWHAFVDDAHQRGLRVVADFNPSYFWTGAPAFQQALEDVRRYGIPANNNNRNNNNNNNNNNNSAVMNRSTRKRADDDDDGGGDGDDVLPAQSPARWFRWNKSCSDTAPAQPDDADAKDGITNSWVRARNASGACYWSIWGQGQPCADLESPEWRAELTAILRHWVTVMKLDGFMFDAPSFYLAIPRSSSRDSSTDVPVVVRNKLDPLSGLHDDWIAGAIRDVIVEPLHALGAAAFGETYNLLRPSYNKMLDAGRNTDMPGGTKGFPSRLHDMIVAGDAGGLEELLTQTVDVLGGWSGGAVRTEPDNRGTAAVAGLKAAVTALVGCYYVVRMGTPNCTSPLPSYGPYPSGDEWPGGCPGKWVGADVVAPTLRAIRRHANRSHSLRPGARRRTIPVGEKFGATNSSKTPLYAALRGDSVVVVFNFSPHDAIAVVNTTAAAIAAGSPTEDLIDNQPGPPIPSDGQWSVLVPAHGWRVLSVRTNRLPQPQ